MRLSFTMGETASICAAWSMVPLKRSAHGSALKERRSLGSGGVFLTRKGWSAKPHRSYRFAVSDPPGRRSSEKL